MGHVVKLINGDKRTSTTTLDLAATTTTGNIFINQDGLTPGIGEQEIIYTGRTSRYDGRMRVSSTRDNFEMSVQLDFRGGNATEVTHYLREVEKFGQYVRTYWEDREGEKTWLEFRWGDGLTSVAAPVYGQWSQYYLIKNIEIMSWDGTTNRQIKAGHAPNVTVTFTCSPTPEGLRQPLVDANGLPDNDSDVTVKRTFSNSEIDGAVTIALWVTHRASDYYAFEYYTSNNFYINVFWDESDSRFEVNYGVGGGVSTQPCSSTSHTAGDDIHIVLTYESGDRVRIYVDSVSVMGSIFGHTFNNNGVLSLGSATSDAVTTANTSGLDSLRIWDSELTATNVLDLYNLEEPIKTAGGTINPPAYFKTRAGDGTLDNVDGTISGDARDNWGVAGWIPGVNPAKAEYQLNFAGGGSDHLWLGRNTTRTAYSPGATHWLEYAGAAADAYSNGTYETQTTSGSGSDTADFDTTLNEIARVRGRVRFLARFFVNGAITVQPYIRFGTADRILGDSVSIASAGSSRFYDLGEMTIDWDRETAPGSFVAGALFTESSASAVTIVFDYIQILPYPNFRIQSESSSPGIVNDDIIVVEGRQVSHRDSDGATDLTSYRFTGEMIDLQPDYYNYLFAQRAEDGTQLDVGNISIWTLEKDLSNESPSQTTAEAIPYNNGVFLVGTGQDGQIWKSTDDGETWTLKKDLSNESPAQSSVNVITYGNGVFLAGTSSDGQIWKSTDDGENWTLKKDLSNESPAQSSVSSIAYGNGVWLAASSIDAQIWKSTDDGENWTLKKDLSNESPAQIVIPTVHYGNGVFLAGTSSDGQIWKSTDDGENWTLKKDLSNESPSQTVVNAIFYNNGNWIAGTSSDGQIWKSTDDGENWTLVDDLSDESPSQTSVLSIVYGNGQWVLTTSPDAQIWASTDDAATWTLEKDLSNESPSQTSSPKSAYGNGVFLVTTNTDGQIWKSTGDAKTGFTIYVTPRYGLPGGLH